MNLATVFEAYLLHTVHTTMYCTPYSILPFTVKHCDLQTVAHCLRYQGFALRCAIALLLAYSI